MENSLAKNEPETKLANIDNQAPSNGEFEPLFTIIHFNDVYDLQPKGGSMGVCYFKAKVDALRK